MELKDLKNVDLSIVENGLKMQEQKDFAAIISELDKFLASKDRNTLTLRFKKNLAEINKMSDLTCLIIDKDKKEYTIPQSGARAAVIAVLAKEA